uniref:protein NETWORKED 3C-like n=1 Tax=Erigeron canadensis TaxID=72917 RepID=UPI001CB9A375|nr:protein NETWORKED 3C-like [Erigeron canadensis]
MENEDGSPHTMWPGNSHNTRLPHSQWLQSTLSDLEQKVKKMMNSIEDDGDTFAKRAEMFYKKKPSLIEAMEDLQGSYRSLAENHYQLMIRLENLRSFYKLNSGSPISGNPNPIPPKFEGFDHDHDNDEDQNSDLPCEGWVSLESKTEKSKVVQMDDEFEKGWSVLSLNMMKLVTDNLEQQAELVKRNDEKREAINNLRSHVSKLAAENIELQCKLAQTNANKTQNRSQLSRAKDVILKRIMPESRC